MKYFLVILLCFLSVLTSAQVTFQKVLQFGSNSLVHRSYVKPATDGGYIILGSAENEFYLAKTDSLGNPIWERVVTVCNSWFCDSSYAYGVEQTMDGGLVVVGTNDDASGPGGNAVIYNLVFVYKFDSSGNTLWHKEYFNFSTPLSNYARSVTQDNQGSLIIGGVNVFNGVLIKVDSLGNTVWNRGYPGLGGIVSSALLPDGSLVSVGEKILSPGNRDIYLMKTDSAGVPLWSNTYGTSGDEIASSVAVLADGGFIIGGAIKPLGANYDAYLIRTDSLGNLMWSKQYGDTGIENGTAMPVADGGFIIAGSGNSFAGGVTKPLLIKVDSLGNTNWSEVYGDTITGSFDYVTPTQDGGYIAAGITNSFGNGIYLVKTDSLGNSGCLQAGTLLSDAPVGTNVTAVTVVESSFSMSLLPSNFPPPVNSGVVVALCPSCPSPLTPAITGGPIPFCPGDSILLTSSPATSYAWSDGQKTQSISISIAGSYTVTVADTSGCTTTSAPFVATMFPLSVPAISTNGSALTSTPAVGYQWYLNNLPIAGATSQTYTATADGIYHVTTLDTNGCSVTSAPFSFLLGTGDVFAQPLSLYPNPTKGTFKVKVPAAGTLTIKDVYGKLIARFDLEKGLNNLRMPLSSTPGIYFTSYYSVTGQKSAHTAFTYQ